MGDDEEFVASPGSPRIYELIQDAPKTGRHPKVGAANTIWAWPEVVDFLKVAGQPVPGPWPPHQEARPDPEQAAAEPTAVAEPAQEAADIARKRGDAPGMLSYRRGGGSSTAEPEAPEAAPAASGAGATDYRDMDAFEKARTTGIVWKGGSLKDLDRGE